MLRRSTSILLASYSSQGAKTPVRYSTMCSTFCRAKYFLIRKCCFVASSYRAVLSTGGCISCGSADVDLGYGELLMAPPLRMKRASTGAGTVVPHSRRWRTPAGLHGSFWHPQVLVEKSDARKPKELSWFVAIEFKYLTALLLLPCS